MKWSRWILAVAALLATRLGGFIAWAAEEADFQIHVFNVGQADSHSSSAPRGHC